MNQKKLIKKSAVFLDRDGTINYDFGYVHTFEKFKLRPNVLKGLKYLTKKKYLIFIVTNQAGIAKGIFKMEQLKKLHKKILIYFKKKNVKIHQIEFCPYHPEGIVKLYKKKSQFRKPGNLMLKKILNKWNIDLNKSFMIGDKNSDKLAAKKTKIYFEFVKKNFYTQVKKIEKKFL